MLTTIRKLLDLFDRRERWLLVGLVAIMVLSGLLQSAGIASIVPFLAVVSNPESVTSNAWLARAYAAFGFQSRSDFLIALGATFLLVMVVSNAANLFTLWLTTRLQWRTHHRLSQRLLRRFLYARYQFHLDHNSAQLGKGLMSEVNRVVSSVFLPLARLVARGISAAFLVALLVWADPRLALIVSVGIGGFYLAVYLGVRGRQRQLGEQESHAKTMRTKLANEAIGGIKELVVLGRQPFFIDQFDTVSRRYASANSANALVGLVPRFALETFSYGGVVVVIMYLLRTRATLDQIFPLVAVYAFGANRLMPSIQEIFQSLTEIRFGSSALDNLHGDLLGSGAQAELPDALPTGPAGRAEPPALPCARHIRFDQVSFRYPGAGEPALRDVSLVIPAHSTCAFVGSTGAGKTTVVDLLLGLFVPSDGRILIDDAVLTAGNIRSWRTGVGYVPQSIFLSDASIADNIAFGVPASQVDRHAVAEAARAAELDDFVGSLAEGFDTVVGERGVRLSGGQRQRIGIARALYHRPDVLILDEATSALDGVTEDGVMRSIRAMAGQRTVIMIAHRLSTVRECDIIFVLEAGRLVAAGSHVALIECSPEYRELARAG